jgi:hypothetical protein
MRRRRPHGLGRLGAAAMRTLPLFPQYATEGRFAGEIHPFIGQHGHDARRGHVGKARLVRHRQQAGAFFFAKRVSRNRTHCTGATILADVTVGVCQRCNVRTLMPTTAQACLSLAPFFLAS